MIREATYEDLYSVRGLMNEVHASSKFNGTTIDDVHVTRMLAIAVTMPNYFFWVVEYKGEIVGALAGAVHKNVWGAMVGNDLVFYSKRDSEKLLRKFIKWSKSMNAEMVSVADSAGNERLRKLIERLGFNHTGFRYTMGI